MSHNIAWYDIPALDLDRAIAFYSAVLGSAVEKKQVGDKLLGLLPTPDGGRMGCVHVSPGFKPSPDGISIQFNVEGRLKETVNAVRNLGGIVQKDIHSIGPFGFMAKVLDSEGNSITLQASSNA